MVEYVEYERRLPRAIDLDFEFRKMSKKKGLSARAKAVGHHVIHSVQFSFQEVLLHQSSKAAEIKQKKPPNQQHERRKG